MQQIQVDQAKEDFISHLEKVIEQVCSGKGDQRHGYGQRLKNQPWYELSKDNNGPQGLDFQAQKKLKEAIRGWNYKNFPLSAYKREVYGVIAYIVFGLMFREDQEEKND